MNVPLYSDSYSPHYMLTGIRFQVAYDGMKLTCFITINALALLPGARDGGGRVAFEQNRDLIHQAATRLITTAQHPLSEKALIYIGPRDLEKELQLCGKEI
ncbi:MAG: DUF1488 family protein [Acidobacteria bacterium]|nr:DUF1488 family protein [Acidobacteriota bacterium]